MMALYEITVRCIDCGYDKTLMASSNKKCDEIIGYFCEECGCGKSIVIGTGA